MANVSILFHTAVYGIFIAVAFGQFGFGGNPFQAQGGGFQAQGGGFQAQGGGFRGPVGGGGGRGAIGGPPGGSWGGARGPINAPPGGGFRGQVGGGGVGGGAGGQFSPFGGLFQQPRPAPDPPMPKGKRVKTKSKQELVDYLVGVISKNHERIAHITHHNYSAILDEEEPVHEATRLDSIKHAIQLHNLSP